MARFLRLSLASWCAALALLGGLLPSNVRANSITIYVISSACFGNVGYGSCSYGAPAGNFTGTSPDAACQAVPTPSASYYDGGWQYRGIVNGVCIWRSYAPGDPSCNTECGGGTATITTTTEQGPSCPSLGAVGADDGNRYEVSNPGNNYMFCHGGCAYWPVGVSGGSQEYGGTIATGKSCSSNGQGTDLQMQEAPEAPKPADGSQCSAPTACSGSVGSTTVCVDCGTPSSGNSSSQSVGTSNTGSTTPGDVTITNSTPATDGSGTVVTTSTTYHADGSKTVVTSIGGGAAAAQKSGSNGGGGAGTGGGTCTGTDCGNDTDSFGGICGTPFTCEGDAIQCAIVKEQHFRACEMYEPATAGGDWADGAQKLATAKADGDVPAWSPAASANAVTTNFNWSTTIDQTSTLGGSCPGDVTVGSTGVVLSLSSLCPYFQSLGTFIVAMTSIACAFILFKGTK